MGDQNSNIKPSLKRFQKAAEEEQDVARYSVRLEQLASKYMQLSECIQSKVVIITEQFLRRNKVFALTYQGARFNQSSHCKAKFTIIAG